MGLIKKLGFAGWLISGAAALYSGYNALSNFLKLSEYNPVEIAEQLKKPQAVQISEESLKRGREAGFYLTSTMISGGIFAFGGLCFLTDYLLGPPEMSLKRVRDTKPKKIKIGSRKRVEHPDDPHPKEVYELGRRR
ncbi:MAG: hypothetical protein KKB21_04965 [Nanoarchaeota archaeon]|nr:hypothetical protein [Nanoarchaeota archaeon]MBU4086897.1 hypothetical protein [Nanoarchaeota archaeon]